MSVEQWLVHPEEVKRFVVGCMVAEGALIGHASVLADTLVAADSRGHCSHGLNRLDHYLGELHSGACDGKATPIVVRETPSTALVDARNGIGSVAGVFCMKLAIEKAKNTGVAWVTCAHSNHYGIAGYYTQMAADANLVGMTMTNTSPLLVPTRSKTAALGTNPISFGAPGNHGDHFMLDMATSSVALGKVEVNHRKGVAIPTGWAVNKDGESTTDPADVVERGGLLMPLGGAEETSGYKGYGLAAMVEVLCGVMSGGPYGPHVRKWSGDPSQADLGQMFMALDPTVFAGDFTSRLGGFVSDLRNLDPLDPDKPVLVAGDPERKQEKLVKLNNGITYHTSIIDAMDQIADRVKVAPLEKKPNKS